ncbi:hypothetical protein H0H92_002410 [Tricholoma furcatifolium]|nr:hypothetical protein H0H92_002410 [Tricholoma furcatifolium]
MALKQPSLAFQRVMLANKLCRNSGIDVVRRILAGPAPDHGWTTDELYQLVLKEPAPEGFKNPQVEHEKALNRPQKPNAPPKPPNDDHPVRSKAFLKREILPFLLGTQEIHKISVPRIVPRASLWKVNKKGKKVALNPDAEGDTTEDVWVWRVGQHPRHGGKPKPKEPVPKSHNATTALASAPDAPAQPSPSASTPLPPEDLDHLNKRRRNARAEKERAERQARAAERREELRAAHMERVMAGVQRARERKNNGALLRERLEAERKQAQAEKRMRKREEARSNPDRDGSPLARKQVHMDAARRLKDRSPQSSS